MNRESGYYVKSSVSGEVVEAFVPGGLPPRNPGLKIDDANRRLVESATDALARVELAAELIPNQDWFLYAFVRKEAVVSSQIEGTQSTLMDLLSHEHGVGAASGVDVPRDVNEVSNHVAALEYALGQLRAPKGLPVSVRLLNEAHKRLLKGVRGQVAQPGEIRQSQNWIGGTRPGNAIYVPPPAERVPELLGALEKYIHSEDGNHPLIRVGLVHAEFETIHPFLDGNGRIGRLLITLLMIHWNLLSTPVLYLSLFFKQHRAEYYRRLSEVRVSGDWEGWIAFFLEAVLEVSKLVVSTSRELNKLLTSDRRKILRHKLVGVSGMRLFDLLPANPIVTVSRVVDLLQTTKPTAGKAVDFLEDCGVLSEVSGRKKDRVYRYDEYLRLLRGDME